MTDRPLRILDVATLVSPDGAYGGPVRVAVNQCAALRKAGHTAEVTAGVRGFLTPPSAVSGVPAHLFAARNVLPGKGFAGMTAPGMLRWFVRHHRDYDVVHVHLARDLVTLPIARLSMALGSPTVVQPHGMIDPSANTLARSLDAALTRPTLRRAARVWFLTARERDDLRVVGGPSVRLEHLRNGTPVDNEPPVRQRTEQPDVLFLARLHPRKHAVAFVESAIDLLREGARATFSLVGPDEGDGRRVRQLITSSGFAERLRWEGALDPDRTRERMSRSAIYVLPSVDEPYPMSVLEAMSMSMPVVITHSCGLAPMVARSESGIVTDPGTDELTDAIRRLIDDQSLREQLGDNAFRTVITELSMDAVADQLENAYRVAIAAART
ncbi:glycosyltransferase [Williamsia maris]|uniref:Glycosyltransferase involved in cell wall bisynthesis n=1 Tax=Williamsia maris TaxID=72806 RepID=A0ABT1HIR9_9NOCA|nr:glycosyltransferase [Williamsia maris]MCP2177835.1 Glycosyltransferase involved in cell wall bisynthesis [Williamsia maris]